MAMEDSTGRKMKRKRCDFDNSGYEFTEPKLSRLDSTDPDVPSLIREHLLNMVDEADGGGESDPTIQGLDSFIRSFEEEILTPAPAEVLWRPDLGYLLEASDDELGLPPSFSWEQKMEVETSGLGEIIGFDEQMPGYEWFGFGFCGGNPENNQSSNDFVAVGTLFDHTEENCL